MTLRTLAILCCLCVSPILASDRGNLGSPSRGDSDQDGLPDRLERDLLQRFRPTFLVSANDCAVLPAEFASGSSIPVPGEENGTIYGQVFPKERPGVPGLLLEIHYYHLWSKDCGRPSHALDAEHVSALVWAADVRVSASHWKALYWFAAAHQGTICDASSAARAQDVHADEHGPLVWISRDKHASFFSQEQCSGGCGGDQCLPGASLPPRRIIPIGEPGLPQSGAFWTGSSRWALSSKMKSDFSESLLGRLDHAGEGQILAAHVADSRIKAVVRTSNTTADAVLLGPQQTGAALSTGAAETRQALRTGVSAASRFFRRGKQKAADWWATATQ